MISSVKKAWISNQIIPVSYPIIYNPEFVVFLNPWVNMQQCAYSWPIILSYLHFKPGHLKLNKDDNVSQQGEQKMAIIQQIYFFHPILMKLGCCCLAWTLFDYYVLAFQCHEKINWIFVSATLLYIYVHTMYMDWNLNKLEKSLFKTCGWSNSSVLKTLSRSRIVVTTRLLLMDF